MTERYRPHVVLDDFVDQKSTRNGARICLITIHDTEGANLPGVKDLHNLGDVFRARGVSAHVATDAEGNSARYVRDVDKAWHCAYYNPWALGIEQIGFAQGFKWGDLELHETARWIAYWNHIHGVPLHKARVRTNGLIVIDGVVRHSELGRLGGSHLDPGPKYPLADVMDMARHYHTKY